MRAWSICLVSLMTGATLVAADVQFGGSFDGAFRLPGSESQKGIDLLQAEFPQRSGDSVDLVFERVRARLSEPISAR